jgi:hypothetical protein
MSGAGQPRVSLTSYLTALSSIGAFAHLAAMVDNRFVKSARPLTGQNA